MSDDMTLTVIPKSDQINADDLIGGPRTITITRMAIDPTSDQPVGVYFEGDNGKPYKACKSMCRVLVHAWGADSGKYIGRSMTLYCDPKVKWAGMEVGGIRISHMSHIPETLTMALTATRGNKKPFTVKPLAVEEMQDWEPAINAVETADELAAVWKSMPADAKKKFESVKDARKAAFTKPVGSV